jgi:hypothetical protein
MTSARRSNTAGDESALEPSYLALALPVAYRGLGLGLLLVPQQ